MINFPTKGSFFVYHPSCVLRVEGEDAPGFLQGQFSNDLAGLSPGRGVYGLWLDRKGRVVADSHVLREGPAGPFWLVSLHSSSAIVRRRLEDFIIADDVSIADETPDWSGISLLGPGTGEWLAGREPAGMRFEGRRHRGEGWEWLLRPGELNEAGAALPPGQAEDAASIEGKRIEAAIPRIPTDIGPADLPQEAGLEAEAVSYSKGCYLGQEVMARLKSRGTLRRRLVRVCGTGAAPALPAPLWSEGRRIGELRSVAEARGGFAGLAMLATAAASPSRPLALSEGGAAGVRVVG